MTIFYMFSSLSFTDFLFFVYLYEELMIWSGDKISF